jgi:TRAP transporter TAXI family solute receptor
MFAKIDQAPELAKKLRTVLNFPMGVYHIAVYESSGIKTLEGVRGKRVFLGPPGGAAYATMERLFKDVAGLEAGTDYEAVKLGWDAAAASFQDGNLDVYCNPTNAPSPVLTQIAVTNPIRFLGIPEDQLDSDAVKALANRPGFGLGTLPAGVYGDNQKNEGDATTLRVTVGIIVNEDADEEMIYEMTKAFFAGVEEMGASAPWLKAINPDAAVADLNMPLHPGSLRALEELGVTIPDVGRM